MLMKVPKKKMKAVNVISRLLKDRMEVREALAVEVAVGLLLWPHRWRWSWQVEIFVPKVQVQV